MDAVIEIRYFQDFNEAFLFLDPSNVEFPSSYNTGCLLGCVNVIDCLSQEEYRQQYPAGPSLEPFVFICEHPRKLPICFPMKGKHKICKYLIIIY